MPLDTVKFGFTYGASGKSSGNTLETVKHNKVCHSMRNFIPRRDGSCFKRNPIINVPLDGAVNGNLQRFLESVPQERWRANLALFVHEPSQDLGIPVIAIGPFRAGNGDNVPAVYCPVSNEVYKKVVEADWIAVDSIGTSVIKTMSRASTLTHESNPPTYFQLISSAVSGYKYELYSQPIIMFKGPCGPREHYNLGQYKWCSVAEGSDEQSYYDLVEIGAKIRLRFREAKDFVGSAEPGVDINLHDYVGYTFAFNTPVEAQGKFLAPKSYNKGDIIHHGDNVYLCTKDYIAAENAPPPVHTEDSEIAYVSDGTINDFVSGGTNFHTGAWQYLHSSVSYARLLSVETATVSDVAPARQYTYGIFEVQKALDNAALQSTTDFHRNQFWPNLPETHLNFPIMGPGKGYVTAHGSIFQSFAVGGGKDVFTVGKDANFNNDIDASATAFISERGDFENFDEYEDSDTAAVSLASSDSSTIRDIIFIDAKLSCVIYDSGTAIIEKADDGTIKLNAAAPCMPAKYPYGGKFSVFITCIGRGQDNVLGTIYRYENNAYVTYTLTDPLYSTLGGVTISKLLYPRGNPEKVIIVRDDGILTVMYAADDTNNVGFYDIAGPKYIMDAAAFGSRLYVLMVGGMYPGVPGYPTGFLGYVDLDRPVKTSTYEEYGQIVEAKIEIGKIIPPMNATQETWIAADKLRSIKIDKNKASVFVNGFEAASNEQSAIVNLHDEWANNEVSIVIESKTKDPVEILGLEIAYRRKALVGNQ